MYENRPAFGQTLAELAELGVIEFRPEPLDASLSVVLIQSGRGTPVRTAVQTVSTPSPDPGIWCGRCDWKTTSMRGTYFYDSEFTSGGFLIAFILRQYAPQRYQDRRSLSPCFTSLTTSSESLKPCSVGGFRLFGNGREPP